MPVLELTGYLRQAIVECTYEIAPAIDKSGESPPPRPEVGFGRDESPHSAFYHLALKFII